MSPVNYEVVRLPGDAMKINCTEWVFTRSIQEQRTSKRRGGERARERERERERERDLQVPAAASKESLVLSSIANQKRKCVSKDEKSVTVVFIKGPTKIK